MPIAVMTYVPVGSVMLSIVCLKSDGPVQTILIPTTCELVVEVSWNILYNNNNNKYLYKHVHVLTYIILKDLTSERSLIIPNSINLHISNKAIVTVAVVKLK